GVRAIDSSMASIIQPLSARSARAAFSALSKSFALITHGPKRPTPGAAVRRTKGLPACRQVHTVAKRTSTRRHATALKVLGRDYVLFVQRFEGMLSKRIARSDPVISTVGRAPRTATGRQSMSLVGIPAAAAAARETTKRVELAAATSRNAAPRAPCRRRPFARGGGHSRRNRLPPARRGWRARN